MAMCWLQQHTAPGATARLTIGRLLIATQLMYVSGDDNFQRRIIAFDLFF